MDAAPATPAPAATAVAHGAMAQPSAWVLRWQHLLAPGAHVLDLACGNGRHVRHLAACGFRLTAVDRDNQALQPLADCANTLCADLETGPWPLAGRQFDAVLVTHYLWRPRWPALRECLAPGGVLVLYGPFLGTGEADAPGNVAFDADLRQRHPLWGVRQLAEVQAEAARVGLQLADRAGMPANNLMLRFRRG